MLLKHTWHKNGLQVLPNEATSHSIRIECLSGLPVPMWHVIARMWWDWWNRWDEIHQPFFLIEWWKLASKLEWKSAKSGQPTKSFHQLSSRINASCWRRPRAAAASQVHCLAPCQGERKTENVVQSDLFQSFRSLNHFFFPVVEFFNHFGFLRNHQQTLAYSWRDLAQALSLTSFLLKRDPTSTVSGGL